MLIWILVAGTFGILNTEMGVIGILPYVARAFDVDIVTASLLFVYGLCNIFGSMIVGGLLTVKPIWTVKLFPIALMIVYVILYVGGSEAVWSMRILTVIWGLLGGINANINQYWLMHVAPEAPDFANGLFLTAANVGTMSATAFCGLFIDHLSTSAVILGGMVYALIALGIVWGQCRGRSFFAR